MYTKHYTPFPKEGKDNKEQYEKYLKDFDNFCHLGNEYINDCLKNNKPPTVLGLVHKLEISRRKIVYWKKVSEYKNYYEQYFYFKETILEHLEYALITRTTQTKGLEKYIENAFPEFYKRKTLPHQTLTIQFANNSPLHLVNNETKIINDSKLPISK